MGMLQRLFFSGLLILILVSDSFANNSSWKDFSYIDQSYNISLESRLQLALNHFSKIDSTRYKIVKVPNVRPSNSKPSSGDFYSFLKDIDLVFYTHSMKKSLIIKYGLVPPESVNDRLLKLKGGYLFHSQTGSEVPYLVYFNSFTKKEALSLVQRLTSKNKHSELKSGKVHSFFELFVSTAFASETAPPGEGRCPGCKTRDWVMQQISMQIDKTGIQTLLTDPVAQRKVLDCILGVLEGAWDVTGGFVWSVGKGAVKGLGYTVRHPVDVVKRAGRGVVRVARGVKNSAQYLFEDGVGPFLSKFGTFFSSMENVIKETWSDFDTLSEEEKAEIMCEVVGMVGGTALTAWFFAGGSAAKLGNSLKQAAQSVKYRRMPSGLRNSPAMHPPDPKLARQKGWIADSHTGPLKYDKSGRPISPHPEHGPSQPYKESSLWKHGPNHAADRCVKGMNRKTGKMQILLIQRKDGTWACAGGFVDSGEAAKTAGYRELEEETGIKLAQDLPTKKIKQGPVKDPRNGTGKWVETDAEVALVDDTSKYTPKPDLDEVNDVQWLDVDSLPPPGGYYGSHDEIVGKAVAAEF